VLVTKSPYSSGGLKQGEQPAILNELGLFGGTDVRKEVSEDPLCFGAVGKRWASTRASIKSIDPRGFDRTGVLCRGLQNSKALEGLGEYWRV